LRRTRDEVAARGEERDRADRTERTGGDRLRPTRPAGHGEPQDGAALCLPAHARAPSTWVTTTVPPRRTSTRTSAAATTAGRWLATTTTAPSSASRRTVSTTWPSASASRAE